MEAILMTFLSSFNTPIMIIIGLVFYFILKNRINLFDKIHDIRKEYANRTFSYVEDSLNGIIMLSYDRMCANLDGHKINHTSLEMEQQKMLYYLILENTFLISIKNEIKNALLQNGFHSLNQKDLKEYCEGKGKRLYEQVIVKLKIKSTMIPTLSEHLGENFSEKEAIDVFTSVVNKSIDMNKERVIAIKKLEKESMVLIGNLFKIIAK